MELTQTKMSPEIKSRWIEAIHTHVFEYPKNVYKASLRASKSAFAIDGILCNLYLKENDIPWQGNKCLGRSHTMPNEVRDWAGLERFDPYLPSGQEYYGGKPTISTLIMSGRKMVDNSGTEKGGVIQMPLSFTDIANLIEIDL